MNSDIRTIGGKIKNAYERLKDKAITISNRLYLWITRHSRYRAEVERSSIVYTPETADVELADQLRRVLDEMAPESGIVNKLKQMSLEERFEFVEKELLPKIAETMDVSYEQFCWVVEDQLCGYYNHKQKRIALNPVFLAQKDEKNDEKLLTIFVNTIIHECKHARQHAAINGKDYGYSERQIAIWKRNFKDYIRPKESDHGYSKQPVEHDASMFANSVIDENVVFEN